MEAGPGVHQFRLADANGAEHDYLVQEHAAGDGMAIMYELLGLGAPSVLGLAGAVLKLENVVKMGLEAVMGREIVGDAGEVGSLTGADVTQLATLATDLDLSAVGIEVGKALSGGRAPKLTLSVLAKTHRDGRALVVGGKPTVDFERAYQANYMELLQVVWRVCTLNRFFPLPATSPSSSGATTAPPANPPPEA